jgi:hypothetical protein
MKERDVYFLLDFSTKHTFQYNRLLYLALVICDKGRRRLLAVLVETDDRYGVCK